MCVCVLDRACAYLMERHLVLLLHLCTSVCMCVFVSAQNAMSHMCTHVRAQATRTNVRTPDKLPQTETHKHKRTFAALQFTVMQTCYICAHLCIHYTRIVMYNTYFQRWLSQFCPINITNDSDETSEPSGFCLYNCTTAGFF